MLQTLLLSQIAQADQPRGAATMTTPSKGVVAKENTGTATKEVKKHRIKTDEEKRWAECMAVGRKFEGMVTHACSIITQAAHESNVWYWPRSELEPLRNVFGECRVELQDPQLEDWHHDAEAWLHRTVYRVAH
jgi:hypothetical protein